MKVLLLCLLLLGVAIYGYFLMRKFDKFRKEARRTKSITKPRSRSLKKRKK